MAGMVARRAHRTKRIFKFTRNHRVRGRQGRTGCAQSRFPGMDIHRGVGVNGRVAGATGGDIVTQTVSQAAQRSDMHAAVGQF